jgi:hypothetical protein
MVPVLAATVSLLLTDLPKQCIVHLHSSLGQDLEDLLSASVGDGRCCRVLGSWLHGPLLGVTTRRKGNMCFRSEWGVCSGDAAGHPTEVRSQ